MNSTKKIILFNICFFMAFISISQNKTSADANIRISPFDIISKVLDISDITNPEVQYRTDQTRRKLKGGHSTGIYGGFSDLNFVLYSNKNSSNYGEIKLKVNFSIYVNGFFKEAVGEYSELTNFKFVNTGGSYGTKIITADWNGYSAKFKMGLYTENGIDEMYISIKGESNWEHYARIKLGETAAQELVNLLSISKVPQDVKNRKEIKLKEEKNRLELEEKEKIKMEQQEKIKLEQIEINRDREEEKRKEEKKQEDEKREEQRLEQIIDDLQDKFLNLTNDISKQLSVLDLNDPKSLFNEFNFFQVEEIFTKQKIILTELQETELQSKKLTESQRVEILNKYTNSKKSILDQKNVIQKKLRNKIIAFMASCPERDFWTNKYYFSANFIGSIKEAEEILEILGSDWRFLTSKEIKKYQDLIFSTNAETFTNLGYFGSTGFSSGFYNSKIIFKNEDGEYNKATFKIEYYNKLTHYKLTFDNDIEISNDTSEKCFIFFIKSRDNSSK
jgi:hypothetical protein